MSTANETVSIAPMAFALFGCVWLIDVDVLWRPSHPRDLSGCLELNLAGQCDVYAGFDLCFFLLISMPSPVGWPTRHPASAQMNVSEDQSADQKWHDNRHQHPDVPTDVGQDRD